MPVLAGYPDHTITLIIPNVAGSAMDIPGRMVAEEMGRIIGFLFGIMSSEVECRVLMLAVRKEYRNHGIGSMLLAQFLREGANRGIHFVSLEVRASNLPAIRFYQRFGFMLTGRIKEYYSNGEDGYTLKLHI